MWTVCVSVSWMSILLALVQHIHSIKHVLPPTILPLSDVIGWPWLAVSGSRILNCFVSVPVS